jgi:zinc protease
VTRDDLVAYYRGRYIPNNIFFVVVGDVDAADVRKQLEEQYTAPARALPPEFIPAEPPQVGRRESHREFPTELTRLHLAWHVPDVTHLDVPALDVAAVALGGGRSSRLYQRLREDRGLVHSIDAWCWAPAERGLFGIDAMLDPDQRGEVERAVMEIIDEIREDGRERGGAGKGAENLAESPACAAHDDARQGQRSRGKLDPHSQPELLPRLPGGGTSV